VIALPEATVLAVSGAPVRRLVAVLAALVLGVCSGCASSARTDDDYRHKVANTAEALNGVLGTVELAVRVVGRDRVPAPYISVTFADADDDAASTQSNFDAIQPPSAAADDLRGKLDDTMQKTVSMLDDLRIAARRDRLQEIPGLAQPLHALQLTLSKLEDVAQ
jgi:hypothetical protein